MHVQSESFEGQTVLVVEDDYLIAIELARRLQRQGAMIAGPVATVAEAMQALRTFDIDAALLDLHLCTEVSFPIMDYLIAQGTPFVFVTSASRGEVPEDYRGYVVDKAADLRSIARLLFEEQDRTVTDAASALRRSNGDRLALW